MKINKTYESSRVAITLNEADRNSFFGQGHPTIILDEDEGDVWLLLQDLLESETGSEIYDQNGGEFDISSYEEKDGKISINYTLFDISFVEDEEANIEFKLTGYFTLCKDDEDNEYEAFVVESLETTILQEI